jgi:hypothetical protein
MILGGWEPRSAPAGFKACTATGITINIPARRKICATRVIKEVCFKRIKIE